jgi:hypothetical protein
MAKRTNRVAWGLVGVLTVLVLIGIGILLRYDVFSARVFVRVAPAVITRYDAMIRKRTQFWEVTRFYHLRFGTLIFSQRYSLSDLPRATAAEFGITPAQLKAARYVVVVK